MWYDGATVENSSRGDLREACVKIEGSIEKDFQFLISADASRFPLLSFKQFIHRQTNAFYLKGILYKKRSQVI